MFGTAELIGLVQIPNAILKGQSELIFNVVFGLFYEFLRSSKGIFMLATFGWNGMRKMKKIEKQSRHLPEKSLEQKTCEQH